MDPLYDVDFVKEMLTNLTESESVTQPQSLKITTNKKIRGLLVSAIEESPLAKIPVSLNMERIFSRKMSQQPSKLEI